MAHFYFSAKLDSERSLCLSVLSDRLLELISDEDIDPSGYYLYETSGTGCVKSIEILARVPTDDAACRLSAMMGLT